MDSNIFSVPRDVSEDATNLFSKHFDGIKKEDNKGLKIKLTNQVHRDIALPEIGTVLGSCLDAENAVKIITIKSKDDFQGLISSISQIATVNGYDDMVKVELVADEVSKVTKKATTSKAKPTTNSTIKA